MDETFLLLIAVIIGVVVLQVYFTLIYSQKTLAEYTITYYIHQYNLSKLSRYIFNYKFEELPGNFIPSSSVYPESSDLYFQLFSYFAANSPKAKVCIYYSSSINKVLINQIINLFETWFHNVKLEISYRACTSNIFECAKNTLRVFPKDCKLILFLDENLAYNFIIINKYAYIINPKKCPECILSAIALRFSGIVYIDQQCVSSRILTLPDSKFINGFICGANIEKIKDYFTSSQASITYNGPSSNLSFEINRLRKMKTIFVPGITFCIFNVNGNTVICDKHNCINTTNIILPEYTSKDNQVLNKKFEKDISLIKVLCYAKYGSCDLRACYYRSYWYRLNPRSYELMKKS